MVSLRYFIGEITQPPELWDEVDLDTYSRAQKEASESRFYCAIDDSPCSHFRDGISKMGFAMDNGKTPWDWAGTIEAVVKEPEAPTPEEE